VANNSELEERHLRLKELQGQGQTVSAADVCADRPDLVAELEERVRRLRRMERLLPLEDDMGPADGYELLEELGAGAMGVVHRARELRSGRVVALKQMKDSDPAAFDRFKKECRTLQKLSHPNLVTLYDVVSDGGRWFFTMELVEGKPFPGRHDPAATGSAATATWRGPDLGVLLPALRQLADGILALHEIQHADQKGVIHRDLKPSNVLVTDAGRVVILDVGVATAVLSRDWSVGGPGLAGTLLYMAPEQADGRPEKASDWYSFGVMLYEALTRRHPFHGTGHEMPWTRHDYVPPPPSTLVAGLPEDLDRLCVELLAGRPADRPTGQAVRRRLESDAAADLPEVPDRLSAETLFLGRERHLALLRDAFADVRGGRTVTVCLHGPSGVGKSTLAQHFLDQVRRAPGPVVLAGRCYERESVPYKALDELIDSLARCWRQWLRTQAEALLPRDVGPLVRLFPALQRVEAVADAPQPGTASADPHEVRRRAVAALREVLARIGDRWPLVLHLDDLQWGDVDSALVLAELLRPPDPPRLLLLACYRGEDSAASPFLSTFRQALQAGLGPDWRELSLEVLSHEEARELAARLLGGDQAATAAAAETIARESGGSPFFVYQLVQAFQAGERAVDLGGVLRKRVAGLPADQRRLLEVVAVASRPVPHEVALQAAGLQADGRKALIDLEMARLLRGGPAEQQEVQTYHDRIREGVLAALPHERLAECHRGLAHALAASKGPDPEAVAGHFQGAGEAEQAAEWYVRAAARAAKALAFRRAARLYRLALELRPLEGAEGQRLRISLADALADAGQGAEAAQVYLDAAAKAGPGEALELRRRAADQFLQCGLTGEGLGVLRGVLGEHGMRLETGRGRALLGLLLERLRLWRQGLRFRERSADSIPPEELRRIDVCFTACKGLSWLGDLVQSRLFQTRYLRLALRAGEPARVALGLGADAAYSAMAGGRGPGRAEKLQRETLALAERLRRPDVLAMVTQMSGVIAWACGRWQEGLRGSDRAEEMFAESRSAFIWDRMAARHFGLDCLAMLGRLGEYARRLPGYLQDARDRGDRLCESLTLSHCYLSHLVEDHPEEAEQAIQQGREKWPAYSGISLLGRVDVALYRGDARQAGERFAAEWPALAGTYLLHAEPIFLLVIFARARVALAQAGATAGGGVFGPRSRHLRSAARDARRIERRRAVFAAPLALLIRAGIACLGGKKTEALALLSAAEDGFTAAEMKGCAAAARRRRGELLGGEKGRELVEAADAWMRGQGVKNPARFAALLAPGSPRAD
jgi:hypothetical protein